MLRLFTHAVLLLALSSAAATAQPQLPREQAEKELARKMPATAFKRALC